MVEHGVYAVATPSAAPPDDLGHERLGDDVGRKAPGGAVDGGPHEGMQEDAVDEGVDEVVCEWLALRMKAIDDGIDVIGERAAVSAEGDPARRSRGGLKAQQADRRGEEGVFGNNGPTGELDYPAREVLAL